MAKKSKMVGNAIIFTILAIGLISAGFGFTGRAEQAANSVTNFFNLPPENDLINGPYTITASAMGEYGSVSPTYALVNKGTTTLITFDADPGYAIFGITVDGVNNFGSPYYGATSGYYLFPGDADHHIDVMFFDPNPEVYEPTNAPTPPPTLAPTPTPTVAPTPTPTPIPTPTPVPQQTLTVGTSGQGSITLTSSIGTITGASGSYNYPQGQSVTLTAIAASNYQFSYWKYADNSKTYLTSTTLTLSTSQSALAVFAQIPQATPTPTPYINDGITPAPTVAPTITPEPTALPIETVNPLPTENEAPIEVTEYVNVNEFAQVGGGGLVIVSVFGLLAYNKLWIFKK